MVALEAAARPQRDRRESGKNMERTANPVESPKKASEWMVALAEEPDNSDLRAAFAVWLAADPAHAVDWAEMRRTVAAIGQLRAMDVVPFRDGLAPPGRPPLFWSPFPARQRSVSSRRLGWGGAMTAAAACLVFLFGSDLALRLEADHLTGVAESRTVRLADGSSILLGPQSAVDVVFGERERRVRLLKGEAFFDVAHEARRPFTVLARDVAATDLGTAFDVRITPDGTDIAVRQGLVQVDAVAVRPMVSEQLAAGDRIRISAARPPARDRIPPDEVASWTQGQLIAKNRPVAEVVDELRPYFKGIILLRGESLARQPLTGVYNLADPVGALRAVARAQGASLHRISPWLLVISG